MLKTGLRRYARLMGVSFLSLLVTLVAITAVRFFHARAALGELRFVCCGIDCIADRAWDIRQTRWLCQCGTVFRS